MRFEFASAGRVVFGAGVLREIGPLARALGRRAFVVAGASALATPPGGRARAAALLDLLAENGLEAVTSAVAGEPTIELVQQGARQAAAAGCDLVVGFGGGSALDAGKAIAALLTNSGDLLDYLEVIGRGRALDYPPAPFIAVPTTAGTGSEVTKNAVLASPEHRLKVSLRSPLLLPRLALVDPDLTLDLPPALTASTGLDALTQLIEPFTSARAQPLTDALCREGLTRAARSLRRACEQGGDRDARADLALASLCGGLALANAGLGAVHGLAAPLGGLFPGPHGALCAALLPHVMRANVAALRARAPHHPALGRYGEVARLLIGRQDAAPEDGAAWVRGLCADLDVPPLKRWGVAPGAFPEIVAAAAAASSMKGNPLPLGEEELSAILGAAL